MVKAKKGKDLRQITFRGCDLVDNDTKRALDCTVIIEESVKEGSLGVGKKTKHNVSRVSFDGLEQGKIDLENVRD